MGLVQGDGASLPLRDGVFDAVLLCFTLELFDTPKIPQVLGECKGALKTGGESVPLKVYEWSHRHFPCRVNCRPIRAQELIQAAGFRVDSRQLLGIWLPVEIFAAVRV